MSDSFPAKLCPQCAAELPPGSLAGLCARCLMAQVIEPTLAGEAMPSIPSLKPEELAPHFPQLEILECLGRGGMGVVYKARQKSLNRLVALKLLAPERADDPQFAARFEREAHALAALNHPHIVGVYDFGRAGGFYFLLMEYIDGVNLRQLLQSKRLTPKEALSIVPPVCDALQCAHDHGIVHRDIKPENLLIDKSGVVKIADFGIAKMVGAAPAHDESAPANSGTIGLGTPDYAAPEQHDNTATTDHRADIYSLGIVLYEMLTGERPKDNFVPPSKRVQVDVRIDEIVLRALEKAPELRYQTAVEFRTQVETVASSETDNANVDSEAKAEDDHAMPISARLWQLVPLVAVLLAFFNPWGGKAWTSFAAGCAILSVLPAVGFRRTPSRARRRVVPPSTEAPRVSRTAIAGAWWLGWGVLAAVWLAILNGEHSRSWWEMSSPEKLGFIVTQVGLVGGFLSVLGTPILGWIAVWQIRRSAGGLRGMGLAVFDGMLFPVLALNMAVWLAAGKLWVANPPEVGLPTGRWLAEHAFVIPLFTLLLCGVVDFLILRAVSRWVARISSPGTVPAPGSGGRVVVMALVLLVAGMGASRWLLPIHKSVTYYQAAAPASMELRLRKEIESTLQAHSTRWKGLSVVVAPDLNTASVDLTGVEEMKGVDGKNVWTEVNGSLSARHTGGGLWMIQGGGMLGHITSVVPMGDLMVNAVLQSPATASRNPSETDTPRNVVAEFLSRLKALREKKADATEIWGLTTGSTDASWSLELLDLADRIRPLHQLGNAEQAMVLSAPFRDQAGQTCVFHAHLVKRNGQWLIDSHGYRPPAETVSLVEGFKLSPSVKFDVKPEELVGTWHFPCASKLTLNADGSGVRTYCGPINVPEKPEPLHWSVGGSILKMRLGDTEQNADITWVTDDAFQVLYLDGPSKGNMEGYSDRNADEPPNESKSAAATKPAIELKGAQQQLEKTPADRQAAQTERAMLPSKPGLSEAEQKAEALKLEHKLQVLEEQAAQLRARIPQSALKP